MGTRWFTLVVAIAILINANILAYGADQLSANNQNNTKLQARISLESKSFDIDENLPNSLINDEDKHPTTTTTHSYASTTIPTTSTSDSNDKKQSKKVTRKASRRLSNIWSMFLPGSSPSSSENDYEEAAEIADGSGEPTNHTDSAPQHPHTNSTQTIKIEPDKVTMTESNIDKHNERLFAKYSKPSIRHQQDGSTSEYTLTSSSGQQVRSGAPINNNISANQSTPVDQPVRLITGALSRPDLGGPQAPSMNEIVSNIMSSVGSTNSSASSLKMTTSSEIEDEDEDSLNSNSNNNNGTVSTARNEHNNFERWLNRIKFQETTSALNHPPTTIVAQQLPEQPGRNVIKPVKASAAWHLKQTDKNVARWPQKLNSTNNHEEITQHSLSAAGDGQVKGHPKRMLANSPAPASNQNNLHLSRSKYNSHPFQQQLRQHQAQLIHGIKYPAAQASTISVNTQDGGASNTSLSFGSHFHIPQLNPINGITETSQVVNSTQSPSSIVGEVNTNIEPSSSNGNGNNNNVEQSVYQSQDEILRQVTSAINFEQQLIQQNRSNELANHNNHKPVHDDNNSAVGSQENSPRLFKVGSSLDELVDPTTSSTPTTSTTPSNQIITRSQDRSPMELLKASLSNSNNNQSTGTEDIDKSFDLLAEKVRLLASQQQNNTQSPSWLRAQSAIHGQDYLAGNLTQLLASLNPQQQQQQDGGQAQSQNQQLNLEQLRELMNRHERTKNELKSSQESMAHLMRQLMQLKSNQSSELTTTTNKQQASMITDKSVANLIGADDHQTQEAPAGVSNIGWTPVGRPGVAQQQVPAPALISPANLVKNRLRPPTRVSQSADNVGLGGDYATDDYFTNNLASLLAQNSQDDDLNQKILGLPIAFIKEDELDLSHGQLEEAARAAAEQLTGHIQQQQARQPMMTRPSSQNDGKFVVPRLAPSQVLHQKQPLAPNQLTNQREGQLSHVQKFLQSNSPQTFNAMRSQQTIQSQVDQQQPNLMPLDDKMAALIPAHDATNPEQNTPLTMSHLVQPGGDHEIKSNGQMANLQHETTQVDKQTTNLVQKQQQQQGNGVSSKQENHVRMPTQQDLNQFKQLLGIQHGAAGQQVFNQNEFRLQRQSHQPAQQVSSNIFEPMARHQIIGQYGQIPQPVSGSLMHDISPLIQARQPMITTTLTGAGPPMKLREVSLYRPFGFRSHHAISYQAAPAVSAMFPHLVGRATQAPSRPSILRHMTPIRATLNESQRLLSPFIPHQLMEHLGHHNHQYPTHTSLGTMPIPPMQQHSFFHGPHQPLRRQSGQHNNWRSGAPRLHNLYAASKVRVRHMDPDADETGGQNLLEEELISHHLGDEIKYIPLPDDPAGSGNRVSEFEEVDHSHLLQMPIDDRISTKKSRPSRQMLPLSADTNLSRQQYGRQIMPQVQKMRINQPSQIMVTKQPCTLPFSSTTTTPTPNQIVTNISTMVQSSSFLTTTLPSNQTKQANTTPLPPLVNYTAAANATTQPTTISSINAIANFQR